MVSKLKVYSRAFLEVAIEKNLVNEYGEDARIIISVLKNDENLKKILYHPDVSADKKFIILKNIFSEKINDDFFGLIDIIILKKRENSLVYILEEFVNLTLEHNNTIVAKLYTPSEISILQQDKIKEKISKIINKNVLIDVIITPELIAGFKIIADGIVIDSSFKKQIEQIRNSMYAHLAKEA
ncbi:MAG: ATP synthase F1 subunit delta [Defluviitaleaceae bacterium]|nr:ATP synthase F1 subunit delta [Defluviitaleaceae bacterium]